jgi:hypothetical protein
MEGSMCCITTIFLVLGPRIAILYWWLTDRLIFSRAFQNWALPGNIAVPGWAWPLLGFIFLPWTTLAYLFLYPGGIVGFEWIVLGVAFLIDMAGHGGSYRHRDRFRSRQPVQTI